MQQVKAYYHLAKPGIIYGNLLSTTAGFFLASQGYIDWWLLLAVLMGTGLVIGSGCVLNNYIDRDIDKKMDRTKKRALVTGSIPAHSAIVYALALGTVGFVLLALLTNMLVVAMGVVGIIFYVVVYGLAKRRSALGTIVGTIPGATPILAGYLAVANHFDSGALLLFLIMAVWQLPHFYAIAIFRLKDYAAAGLPVLPVTSGTPATKRYILTFIALYLIIAPLLTVFHYTGYSYGFAIALLGLAWLWKGLQGLAQADSTAWARSMFGFSLIVLLSFSGLLIIEHWLP